MLQLNNMYKSTLVIIVMQFSFSAMAQTKAQDTLKMSLSAAVEYAITHNPDLKNAYADLAIANQTVKEVQSIGIPQIKGQIGFQDAIQKQVFVFPINGIATPIRVGNKYTTQASINATWLLLDGTYFLGLKAAKQFTDLSRRLASKTETDVKIDVAKTYLTVLIAKENVNLLNTSYNTIEKTYNQVKAMNKEGFTEALDVDRLKLQLNNISITRQKLNDQLQIVMGLLKIKMGMDPNQNIDLTDKIDELNNRFAIQDTSTQVNFKARTDFQILQQQLVLNKMDVKRYQYGKLPNLAGAFTYQQSNFGETLDYSKWYNNYFLAMQMNVPLFSGFSNDAKIQKAKIQQLKTETTINKVENMIQLEAKQTQLKYFRAMDYVMQQKENLDLANKILNTTTIKYNEGVGSNLELITASQELKTTQTNYLSAVYDLLVAKIDYQVAIGQTIKL
jgi:outer membrane protein TolC